MARGSDEPARAAAALAAWRAELSTAGAVDSRPRWVRKRLAPTALLYRQQAAASRGRRLIVGFAGNHQRLMLPTHAILDHLPPHDDLLLLSDPDRQHFAAGARGIADTLGGVCEWLAARLADWDYESVVTFGTSAGGLAAIGAAPALGTRGPWLWGPTRPPTIRRWSGFSSNDSPPPPANRRRSSWRMIRPTAATAPAARRWRRSSRPREP